MSSRKVWNLYSDDSISSLKNVFNICSSEDIEEFWLFFQENSIIEDEDIIHLIIKYLFDYTSKFLLKVDSYDVIIEYTQNIQYITFWHQNYSDILKDTYVDLKNYSCFNLQISDEKATFQIIKIGDTQKSVESELKTMNILENKNENISPVSRDLIVYDFINKDDLMSMNEINDELLNQMFYISSSQIDEDKLDTIISELDTYISIFSKYKKLENISNEVVSFRDILEGNIDLIMKNTNSDLNMFFEGIITNIKNWTDMSFSKGIEDIDYYNASIASDISMIKQLLKIENEVIMQEDDDIFF